MKYLAVFCFVTALGLTIASDVDGKIELIPEGKPSPALRRGALEDVVPKGKPPLARIISSNFATPTQLPYQVGILIGFENNAYAWCGGTLIGNEWIITAAHCTSGAKSIEVRLGSVYSDQPLRVSWGYQNHVHPDWLSKGDDISLVKMQWVDYNVNMAPAALPARNGHYWDYVGARVVASGWGSVNDEGQGSHQLKYVAMTVMNPDTCAGFYGADAKHPRHLCTDTKGVGGTCSGDSGGPLVIENTRTLVGVTAFVSAAGCTKGMPDGFTRITHYLDWINEVSGISW